MFQRQESLWRPCKVINPVMFSGEEEGKAEFIGTEKKPQSCLCVAKGSV